MKGFFMWDGCELLWPEDGLWQIAYKYCPQFPPFWDVYDAAILGGGDYFPCLEPGIVLWLHFSNKVWQRGGSRISKPWENWQLTSLSLSSGHQVRSPIVPERHVERHGGAVWDHAIHTTCSPSWKCSHDYPADPTGPQVNLKEHER